METQKLFLILKKLETKHWNNIISIHFLLDFHIFNDDNIQEI